MKSRVLFFFIFLLCLVACNNRLYQYENLPEKQLVFGNGGGFTGSENSYTLLENGQLFKTELLTNKTIELVKIKASVVQQIFKKVEAINIQQFNINDPGNTYSFIEKKASKGNKRLTWHSETTEVPKSITDLYKELYLLIQLK